MKNLFSIDPIFPIPLSTQPIIPFYFPALLFICMQIGLVERLAKGIEIISWVNAIFIKHTLHFLWFAGPTDAHSTHKASPAIHLCLYTLLLFLYN